VKLNWMVAWSLDASLVLLAYFWALNRVIDAEVPMRFYLMLGAGVWAGYMGDRIFDVLRRPDITRYSERHRKVDSSKWRWMFLWCSVVAFLVTAGLCLLEPMLYLRGWMLACGAAVYVFMGSLIRDQGIRKWIKKVSAACLLMVSPWVFDFEQMTREGFVFAALFGFLVLLNLLMVDRSEGSDPWGWKRTYSLVAFSGVLSWFLDPLSMAVTLVFCWLYFRFEETEQFSINANKRVALDFGLLVYCLMIGGMH